MKDLVYVVTGLSFINSLRVTSFKLLIYLAELSYDWTGSIQGGGSGRGTSEVC